MQVRRIAYPALALTLCFTSLAIAETYRVDPAHTSVLFRVRHLFTTVTGRFQIFEGKIVYDEKQPTQAKVEGAIDAASIDTNVKKRDDHLRSADFFDVEKYPQATFKSTKVEDIGGDRLRIIGDLTLHGMTRSVTLEGLYEGSGKDPWGGERAGFSANVTIDRREFGLQWNKALETGGVLVGDKVELTLEVEAVKQVAAQAA